MDVSTNVPRAWVLAGHYFRVLALFSILHTISLLLREARLSLDLTFILLFWIGRGLLEGKRWSRIVALVICSLMTVLPVVSLGYSIHLVRQQAWGSVAALQSTVVSDGILLALLVFPLTMLLRQRNESIETASDNPADWTRGRTLRYLGAALLLGALIGVVDLQRGQVSLSTSTAVIAYGDGKTASTVVTYATENPTAASLFVSSWVIGESDTSGVSSSGRERTLTIGNRKVDPQDVPRVSYLKFAGLPPEPASQPNILLVRADGRIIPIQRRITLQTLGVVERGLRGSADFDEMQRRIEALLPPLAGAR
jgi:hypothetical protein